MKKFSTLLILLFISFSGFAQTTKIDSLLDVLSKNENNEESRLKILEKLTEEFNNQSDLNHSLKYFQEMYNLAVKLKNVKIQNQALLYISEGYIKENDFENSKKYAFKAIETTKENMNELVRAYNQLGRVYDRFQKYDEAVNSYNQGISIGNKFKEYEYIGVLYSNLGAAYGRVGNTDKQIKYYLKAAEFADKSNHPHHKSMAYYQIGYIYMNLEQYEKAEQYFVKGLKYVTDEKYRDYKYMIHHARGINFSRNGKYEEALRENNIALQYWQSVGNKLYEYDVLNNIAVVYFRMDEYRKAIEYGNKALLIAKSIGHKRAIMGANFTLANAYLETNKFDYVEKAYFDILKDTIDTSIVDKGIKSQIFHNLGDLYKKRKDYQKAYLYTKKYALLNDSILSEQRDSNIAELETRYQTEKKEKQIAEQELKLEKGNRNKWLLGGGIIGLSAILSIGGIYFRRNQKQKKQIENLQKELHHRVKNNLSIIDTFVEVLKNEIPGEKAQLKLTELQNRIISINEVHRQLYQSRNITRLNLKRYIETLAENLSHSFDKPEIQIKTEIPESAVLGAERSFPVGLITNEFLTNSYKYAFDGDEPGRINITLNEKENDYIMRFSDNGKGLPADFDIEKDGSFGLRIMKLLTEQLNGAFTLNGNNGVSIEVQFPKS